MNHEVQKRNGMNIRGNLTQSVARYLDRYVKIIPSLVGDENLVNEAENLVNYANLNTNTIVNNDASLTRKLNDGEHYVNEDEN